MKQSELWIDPIQGKSPEFYRLYYRRLMILCIVLSLIALGQIGYMAVNYVKDYIHYDKYYYVSTLDGRLVGIYPTDINDKV